MSLIKHLKRPAVGAKAGGMYADGLVPQQPKTGMGIGAAGYMQMLDNIKNGRMPTADQTARLGLPQAATPAVPSVSGSPTAGSGQSQSATQSAATASPTAQPAQPATPAAPAAPAQPKGLSISNGMDSGGGLQITNGFDSPAPAAPAPQAAAPATPQQPTQQQPQKFARGRVPNALINGIVRGEGGPTEDKVPAKVSPDEAILPAKTVQALGGPAAIKALIERTNDGQPPESEVKDGGKYAVGYNGMYDTPNIYKQDNDKLRQAVDQNFFPSTRASYENASRETSSAANSGNTAYAVGRALRGGAEAAGSVPIDIYNAGKSVVSSAKSLAGSAADAVAPSLSSFWSGLSGRSTAAPAQPQPQPQDSSVSPVAEPQPSAAASPLAQTPAKPTSTPAPAQASEAVQGSPSPVPLIAAAQYRNTPDAPPEMRGADYANQQLANIRGGDERGPKVGIIADPAAQERRAFDNFVTRSNGEAAYRDAIRSGKPQNIQAASNALANLTQVGDQQEYKAGEFQRGMDALATKSLFDREAENNRGRIGLAQAALQGKNALASETMRGNNALVTEAMRGTNALAVADRNAAAQQAAREYMNPLDAQLKQAQLSDANVKASLRDKILNASPEEQAALARQVAAMDGRYADKDNAEMAKARMGLIGEIAKAYNGPMGAPLGPDKMPIPFDQYAAPILRAAGASGGQPEKQQTPGTVSTGQVINGYRFKGGDPSKQSSWEKA